jgi:hypothetical protein
MVVALLGERVQNMYWHFVRSLCLSLCLSPIQVFSQGIEQERRNETVQAMPLVMSWNSLEVEMLREITTDGVLGKLSLDDFSKSAVFRRILNSDNAVLWNAMLVSRRTPVVALAGWHCICDRRPSDKIWASFSILASAESPGNAVYAPAYKTLSDAEWREQDRKMIGRIVANPMLAKENVAVLVACIPRRQLQTWFDEVDWNTVAGVDQMAVITGELYGAIENSRQAPSAQLRRRLNQLSAIPGIPQYIFALYGDVSHPGFDSILINAFNSSELSDLEAALLMTKRWGYVEKQYGPLSKMLSPPRRKLLEQIRARKIGDSG